MKKQKLSLKQYLLRNWNIAKDNYKFAHKKYRSSKEENTIYYYKGVKASCKVELLKAHRDLHEIEEISTPVQNQDFEIFNIKTINLDFKDLSNLKHSLDLHIELLENINFGGIEDENIQEHKDLLNRIDKKLREFN